MSHNVPFTEWMQQVDTAVFAIASISVHDLEDQPFYDWWQDGYTPEEAAEETLEYAGYPMDALLYSEEVGFDRDDEFVDDF